MLAVVMLMSVVAISASAAQVEIADNSADAVADVAADGLLRQAQATYSTLTLVALVGTTSRRFSATFGYMAAILSMHGSQRKRLVQITVTAHGHTT
jgi:hypothetical protein